MIVLYLALAYFALGFALAVASVRIYPQFDDELLIASILVPIPMGFCITFVAVCLRWGHLEFHLPIKPATWVRWCARRLGGA